MIRYHDILAWTFAGIGVVSVVVGFLYYVSVVGEMGSLGSAAEVVRARVVARIIMVAGAAIGIGGATCFTILGRKKRDA
jgi:hypothetical protein